MGRFVESDINQRDGFIREMFMNVCNSCDADQIKTFAGLSNDAERFRFLSSMKSREVFKVTRNTDSMKNYALALAFKQTGNEKFQSKQWMAAADSYNKSLLILPSEHGEWKRKIDTKESKILISLLAEQDFAILLANRSAAFYHMEKYDHALQDIELAETNYPVEMMHKLKERSARCHLAKKDLDRALKSFQWVSFSLRKGTDGSFQ